SSAAKDARCGRRRPIGFGDRCWSCPWCFLQCWGPSRSLARAPAGRMAPDGEARSGDPPALVLEELARGLDPGEAARDHREPGAGPDEELRGLGGEAAGEGLGQEVALRRIALGVEGIENAIALSV